MKRKFKVKDTIVMLENCSGCVIGEKYILKYGSSTGDNMDVLWADGKCRCQHSWKFVQLGSLTLDETIDTEVSKLRGRL